MLKIFLRPGLTGTRLIHLRNIEAQFIVRGKMDVWSVKETFLDRFYEKYGTTIGEPWEIIDIGAGIGDFTLLAAQHHPGNTVYAYEPFSESYSLLIENLKLNKVNNVQTFSEAIGSKSGRLALDLEGGEPLQLQSREVEEKSFSEDTLIVPSLSLADAFSRHKLGRCDLLKLDCEGAEYAILFNAPDETLACIDRIVMEYHDHVTRNTHKDMERFLSSKGFSVLTHPNAVHGYLGYLYAYREARLDR